MKLQFDGELSIASMKMTLFFLQWVYFVYPAMFPNCYVLVAAIVLLIRVPMYYQQNFILFMLDPCYLGNYSLMLQLTFCPENSTWFAINYMLCMSINAPSSLAFDSLVTFDMSKFISTVIHIGPVLVVHTMRWNITGWNVEFQSSTWNDNYAYFFAVYFLWLLINKAILTGTIGEQGRHFLRGVIKN